MPSRFAINKTKITPIQIRQEEEPELYEKLRKWRPVSNLAWFLATQEVLQLILNNRPSTDLTKQAVWHFWKRHEQYTHYRSFHEKIGKGFPNISFANKCFALSEKEAQKIIYTKFVCSYQFCSFNDNRFGVSTRLIFEIIPMSGKTRIINHISGMAGLHGWENLALILGLNYRLGLIGPYDQQFQNILQIADKSVENQSADFRPKGNSISKYVRNLFYLINRELPPRAV